MVLNIFPNRSEGRISRNTANEQCEGTDDDKYSLRSLHVQLPSIRLDHQPFGVPKSYRQDHPWVIQYNCIPRRHHCLFIDKIRSSQSTSTIAITTGKIQRQNKFLKIAVPQSVHLLSCLQNIKRRNSIGHGKTQAHHQLTNSGENQTIAQFSWLCTILLSLHQELHIFGGASLSTGDGRFVRVERETRQSTPCYSQFNPNSSPFGQLQLLNSGKSCD